VLSCSEGQASEDEEDGGVFLHRRGVPHVPKLRRLSPAAARRLEGAVARYREYRHLGLNFDVVEAPDWLAEGLVFALIGSRPLVAHLHSPLAIVEPHNPASFRWTRDAWLADRLERLAVRRSNLVTSPSRLLADDLARTRWLGDHQPRIIRYPIALRPWENFQAPEDSPPRVVSVGRLEGRKAPEVLVQAAAILAKEIPDLDVVFIGRPSLHDGSSYRDWLVELATRLRAPCRFIDHVGRSELPSWYASARVVALPSRYDNFPYVGLEAMASSRPVVCSDQTGIAEILNGTGGGAVIPVDDAPVLAEALRLFLVDPAAAGRAGRAARSLVERECSPDRIAEEREVCYREAIDLWIASGRRRRRATSLGSR
jgi:glycosyltransferase involved in cell wall biosynthesis